MRLLKHIIIWMIDFMVKITMKTIKQINVLFIFSLLALLQGCQDSGMADLRAFVDNTYKDNKPEIEPLPEIQPYQGFEYQDKGLVDPFDFGNIIDSKSKNESLLGLNPDDNRRKEPLEQYPLDALSMVGTMSRGNVPWVIVQTSEGTAHRATIGNYMGQNDGKITEISLDEQKVLLSELVLDPAGRWINKEVEITIDNNNK